MLRHSVIACARDTREGVSKPRVRVAPRTVARTAASTGPYPPPDEDANGLPTGDLLRRPSDNHLCTVSTPVIVHPERLNVVAGASDSFRSLGDGLMGRKSGGSWERLSPGFTSGSESSRRLGSYLPRGLDGRGEYLASKFRNYLYRRRDITHRTSAIEKLREI